MPELPEVEALAQDLRGRLVDRAIARIDLAAFSALKTFDPPLHSLHGTLVEDVTRHGKFLDITASGTHLIIHLARAGWIRWRDEVPQLPAKPSTKNPLAARVVIDDPDSETTPGLDITEAGTKKSLAIYVVRDPQQVEGIARLGPDPLDEALPMPAMVPWCRRTPLICLRPSCWRIPASTSIVNASSSGSGPSRAMPSTCCGSRTT